MAKTTLIKKIEIVIMIEIVTTIEIKRGIGVLVILSKEK